MNVKANKMNMGDKKNPLWICHTHCHEDNKRWRKPKQYMEMIKEVPSQELEASEDLGRRKWRTRWTSASSDNNLFYLLGALRRSGELRALCSDKRIFLFKCEKYIIPKVLHIVYLSFDVTWFSQKHGLPFATWVMPHILSDIVSCDRNDLRIIGHLQEPRQDPNRERETK